MTEQPAAQAQQPGRRGASEEEVVQAARETARAQAVLEMEQMLQAEEQAQEDWEAAENRRLNHAATLSFAARDFAEVGDFKAAVGSARQALGLDPANIEARAVLNYCRSFRRAARSAAPVRQKARAGSRLSALSQSAVSTTSLNDGPAFAILDGDTTRRTVVGRRPVSASPSFASVESTSNRKPRTLFILNSSSATSIPRAHSMNHPTRLTKKSDDSSLASIQPQVACQLLRESGSTAWVTVGPAPDDVAWTGDQELLERVENLESAFSNLTADMSPEESEPEVPTCEIQTVVTSECIDVWRYVYEQAAHLYNFVPGEYIEVLSRRYVKDKKSGEASLDETWYPAVVTQYSRPRLSDTGRACVEVEADVLAVGNTTRQREHQEGAAATAETDPDCSHTDVITPQAHVVDAREGHDDGAGVATSEVVSQARNTQALEIELRELSVGGLRAKAAQFGIPDAKIAAAWRSSDPSKALINLIVGFAEEAYESGENGDKTEAEAEPEAKVHVRAVGLLDSWSVQFVYLKGREPPRYRAKQPLHGTEVTLLLAPPSASVVAGDNHDNNRLAQQGVDMVRRIERESVDWATVKRLEAKAERERLEAEAAKELAVAEREEAEVAEAVAHEEEQEAARAAAALAEELEEASAARARAELEAADVATASEALRLAIEGGDADAIAAAKANLQKESHEANESDKHADKEEADVKAAEAHYAEQEQEAQAARAEADKERKEAEHYRLIYEKEAAEAAAARAEAIAARADALTARDVAEDEKASLLMEQEKVARAQAETEELRVRIELMEEAQAQRAQEDAAEAERLAALAEEEQVSMSTHLAALAEQEARAEKLTQELAQLQTDHERLHAMYVAARTASARITVGSASGMPNNPGRVICKIVGCSDLLVADRTSSDPFVAIWFGDEEMIQRAAKSVAAIPKKATSTDGTVNNGWCRTTTVKNTVSPKFTDEEFEFKIGPNLVGVTKRNLHLHVRVFDRDRLTGSDQLGEYDVDLCQCFGMDWQKYVFKNFSDTVELVDYQGKVKKKLVKRKLSDLVDVTTSDRTKSECDLKSTLLDKTIYGKLSFSLRFRPD